MAAPIPFNRPHRTGREATYVAEALASDHWRGDGPFTRRAAALLAAATKPMIFVGDGVAYSGAQDELTRVAELLGAEVWEADAGEVNIDYRHPLHQGMTGHMFGYASKPIISAGDGVGEHPTQGLLDLYTIRAELGAVDGLHVAMVGDLKNGRTVHSLARLLRLYDATLTMVSPDILRLPEENKRELIAAGRTVYETDSVEDVIESADVLYVTRVQKERFADLRRMGITTVMVTGDNRLTAAAIAARAAPVAAPGSTIKRNCAGDL